MLAAVSEWAKEREKGYRGSAKLVFLLVGRTAIGRDGKKRKNEMPRIFSRGASLKQKTYLKDFN